MERFFQNQLEKENLRIAFFGDQYMSDVHYSAVCDSQDSVKWEAIAVIEELALFDKDLEMGTNPDHVLTDKYWGENYFVDDGNKSYLVGECA